MQVEAEVWYWTKDGMRRTPVQSQDQYILKSDAERLLQDAHRRGWDGGVNAEREIDRIRGK